MLEAISIRRFLLYDYSTKIGFHSHCRLQTLKRHASTHKLLWQLCGSERDTEIRRKLDVENMLQDHVKFSKAAGARSQQIYVLPAWFRSVVDEVEGIWGKPLPLISTPHTPL